MSNRVSFLVDFEVCVDALEPLATTGYSMRTFEGRARNTSSVFGGDLDPTRTRFGPRRMRLAGTVVLEVDHWADHFEAAQGWLTNFTKWALFANYERGGRTSHMNVPLRNVTMRVREREAPALEAAA